MHRCLLINGYHGLFPQSRWASSGFHREADENRVLLSYYAASSNNNFLPTFRDNLSVQSSRLKVRNYHYSLRNNPEESSSHLFDDILHLSFASFMFGPA